MDEELGVADEGSGVKEDLGLIVSAVGAVEGHVDLAWSVDSSSSGLLGVVEVVLCAALPTDRLPFAALRRTTSFCDLWAPSNTSAYPGHSCRRRVQLLQAGLVWSHCAQLE